MDLSDLDTLPEAFDQLLGPLSASRYDSCLLINNAGSVEPLGLASSVCDEGASSMRELRKAIDFNITSSIWVSSQFTKRFSAPIRRIVNISSLCALEPFPTMSIYCSGKAGRDMFHSVLAKENAATSDDSDDEAMGGTGNENSKMETAKPFKVLNYAPGACATLMTDTLAECPVLDAGLHKFFATSKEENKLVRPEDTARKLVGLLVSDSFESGSHVDYWDV